MGVGAVYRCNPSELQQPFFSFHTIRLYRCIPPIPSTVIEFNLNFQIIFIEKNVTNKYLESLINTKYLEVCKMRLRLKNRHPAGFALFLDAHL